jgi:hypothetical protein
MTNCTACLTWSGSPGEKYDIEATTNVADPSQWIKLCTVIADTNGQCKVIDADSVNYQSRFYRVAPHGNGSSSANGSGAGSDNGQGKDNGNHYGELKH